MIDFVTPPASIGCHYTCKTCSVSLHKDKCDTCIDGFVLNSGTCTPSCTTAPNLYYSTVSSGCVASCPDGQFLERPGLCQPCSTKCQKCKNAGICSLCDTGFRRTALGVCEDATNGPALGQYMDPFGVFQYCHPFCKDCTGPTPKECSGNCKVNVHIKNDNGDCEDDCDSGFFFDHVNFNCSPCKQHCKKCNSENLNHCTECDKGMFLSHGICVTSCPEGYITDKENEKCIHTSSVTGCSGVTYFYGGRCLKECPLGTYSNRGVCEGCPAGCAKCGSS